MMTECCPTCGQPVRIVSGDEGTSHYESPCGLAALREAAQAVVGHLSLGGRMSRSSPEIIDLDRAVLASADSENRETP